jgi:hypothetical protein
MDILYNYKIFGNIPLSYWVVKNHKEMMDWIIKHSPYRFPAPYLDKIAELELIHLLELKIEYLNYANVNIVA